MNRLGLLLVAAVVWTGGCLGNRAAGAQQLIGAWSADSAAGLADAGIEFKLDGTWHQWYKGTRINTEDSGTYLVSGSTINLTQTKHIASDGQVNSAPKTFSEEFRVSGKDKLELTTAQGKGTYTRKS